MPFAWVAADAVYGVGAIEQRLRRAGKGYVLGVTSTHRFNSWGRPQHENKAIPPGSPEFYLKAVMFGAACQQIAEDTVMPSQQKLDAMRSLISLMFGVENPVTPTVSSQPAPRLSPSTSDAEANQNVSTLLSSPTSHIPISDPAIVRVFMKANIQARGVAALQVALPDYDVRIGKSDIDPSNVADVLFVNRATVSKAQIIRVLSALADQGVAIKSVQKSGILGNRKEIQVGTILTDDGPMFRDDNPLDISDLSQEQGVGFWKAAFNGKALCNDAVGTGQVCHISNDGRPMQ